MDLRCGLMFANEASQKHVSIGPFGGVGNGGSSGGNDIGASDKSPSGRSIEGGPLEKFVLHCMPHLSVRQRYLAMPYGCS